VRHGWLVLTLSLLVLAAPAEAQVKAGTTTASAGTVVATLSWQAGDIFAEHPSLRILRAGAVAFDGALEEECRLCAQLGDARHALTVRDLDGDGDPEILVDTYTGGAHCCVVTPIFRWTGSGYRKLTGYFGNVGYSLDDLDNDGRPEFVTADDSFAYAFTAYAFSAFPLLILDYGTDRSGRTALRDVSAGYRGMIEAEAADYRREIPKYRSDDPRGVIAAYVADLYRLGRKHRADAYLRSALKHGLLRSSEKGPDPVWPTGRKYVRELKRFLRKHGYLG